MFQISLFSSAASPHTGLGCSSLDNSGFRFQGPGGVWRGAGGHCQASIILEVNGRVAASSRHVVLCLSPDYILCSQLVLHAVWLMQPVLMLSNAQVVAVDRCNVVVCVPQLATCHWPVHSSAASQVLPEAQPSSAHIACV